MIGRRQFLAGATATACLLEAAKAANGVAQTVLGPLDAARLGFTLVHEHIADAPDVLNRWPKDKGGRTDFTAEAIQQLRLVRAAGTGAIVDLTTYDVGRDIRFLREVSRQSGLAMIAATGQRFFPPQLPHVIMPSRTIEGLAKFFIREIWQGIDATGIRAGVIKIGIVGKAATAIEEVGLRAGARTARATGAPIRIHTRSADRAGENHAVILESEGIDPSRVSFDHSDDSGDMDYFLGLVRRGYSLSMDHVHRGLIPAFRPDFARRADCIKQLVDAGFARNIFLSQDAEFGGALLPQDVREWRETIDPPEGMLFVSRKLIQYLKTIGVSDDAIRVMTVENPRRFFALA